MKSSSLRTLQSVRSVQSRTKATTTVAVNGNKQTIARKKVEPKAKRSESSDDNESESSKDPSKSLNVSRASVTAVHGSVESVALSSNDDHHEVLNHSPNAREEKQTDQQLHRLQQKLHSSLNKLGEVMPWLHKKNALGSPAIRATFLAASAFHQSLDIMVHTMA